MFRAALSLFLVWGMVCPIAAAESALLAKVRAGGDVKVVLLGTSLTAAGSWPGSLQTWLTSESPGPGTVTVVNRAVSGKASNHGLATQTPLALTDNPDAIFIEFSMNDAATSLNITQQQAEDNLNAMLDQFIAQNANVIIVLQTMNSLPPDTSPFSPRNNLNDYYQIYRDVATERDAILIDHYPNWLNLYTTDLATWNTYMKDAVHPNQLGEDTVLMPFLKNVLNATVDETPPTLASTNIVDNQSGGAVAANTVVTYTISFSKDMDAATVDAADFSNAGSSAINIGAITETSPGVFSVEVSPTTISSSLQIQVSAAAVLADTAGNLLDTTAAITDDTTLQVGAANAQPVWTNDPLNKANATQGSAYAASLAGDATDSESLTFAKVNGPGWLQVSSNGELSGSPSNGDVGGNSFTVSANDGITAPVEVTLNITVTSAQLPPTGGLLVAWDDWVTLTVPDDSLAGFTGSVVSTRLNQAFGSTDGTYGADLSGATVAVDGALLPRSSAPDTTITITNNTGQSYSIDSLHFDFVQRLNSAKTVTVNYIGGGLAPASTQIATSTFDSATSDTNRNFDLDLSPALSDIVLDDGESATFEIALTGFSNANSSFIDNLAIQGSPVEEVAPLISAFTYDPLTGTSVMSIKGRANTAYKLVEADDLDFSNPDQDPIPLTSSSVGTLDGNVVITTPEGDATVELNLGTEKDATFIRGEEVP